MPVEARVGRTWGGIVNGRRLLFVARNPPHLHPRPYQGPEGMKEDGRPGQTGSRRLTRLVWPNVELVILGSPLE